MLAGLIIYGIQQHDVHEAIAAEQKYLDPLQHGLKGYDPRGSIEQQLAASVQRQPWGKNSTVHIVDKLPGDDAGPGDNAQIHVDYALSPDFSELVMRATVTINHSSGPNSPNRSPAIVYRNLLISLSAPAVMPKKTEVQKQRLYAQAMRGWDQHAVNAEIDKLNQEGVSAGSSRDHILQKLHLHDLAVKQALSNQWSYAEAMQYRVDYWQANHAQPIRDAINQGAQALAELLDENLQGKLMEAQTLQAGTTRGFNSVGALPGGEIVERSGAGLFVRDPSAKVLPFVWANPVTPDQAQSAGPQSPARGTGHPS